MSASDVLSPDRYKAHERPGIDAAQKNISAASIEKLQVSRLFALQNAVDATRHAVLRRWRSGNGRPGCVGRRPTGRGNSTVGDREVDLVRTLILIGTALGLGAGLVCTGLFAWWLSYPVHFYVGSYEPLGAGGNAGHMESVDPIPFLAGGLVLSAVLGAVVGLVAARRGYRLSRHRV